MIKRKSGPQGNIQLRRSGRKLRFDPLGSFEGLQLEDCREIALFQKNKMKAVRWWKEGVHDKFGQQLISLREAKNAAGSEAEETCDPDGGNCQSLERTKLDWVIPHSKEDKEMFVRVTLKQSERHRTKNGVSSLRSKVTIPKQDFWLPYFYPEPIEYGETTSPSELSHFDSFPSDDSFSPYFSLSLFTDCPYGWTFFEHQCYKYMEESLKFEAAEIECKKHKAHLVSIHTREEDEFIKKMILSKLEEKETETKKKTGYTQQNVFIGGFLTRTRRWPEYGDFDAKRMFQLNRMDWIWMDQTPFGFRNIDWINRTSPYLYSAGNTPNDLDYVLPKNFSKGFNKQQKNNIYNDFWYEGREHDRYHKEGFKEDRELRERPLVQTNGTPEGYVPFVPENLIDRPVCLSQRWIESFFLSFSNYL